MHSLTHCHYHQASTSSYKYHHLTQDTEACINQVFVTDRMLFKLTMAVDALTLSILKQRSQTTTGAASVVSLSPPAASLPMRLESTTIWSWSLSASFDHDVAIPADGKRSKDRQRERASSKTKPKVTFELEDHERTHYSSVCRNLCNRRQYAR